MLYYLTRIIVEITPLHVRWWPDRSSLDQPPSEWRAPSGTALPPSDAAPTGKPSPAPSWEQPSWQELRRRASDEGLGAHLTLCDENGHPLPMRVHACRPCEAGFALDVPKGAPWREGKATLSFIGKYIFVGDAVAEGEETRFTVERALPVWPLMTETIPSERTLGALLERLQIELDRRGLAAPVVPLVPPEPTEGALLRREEYSAKRCISAD
jgi:hypothetical protein